MTIGAEALAGRAASKIVDELAIDVDNTQMKYATGASKTDYTFTPNDSKFTYRCWSRNSTDPAGADTWTRTVRVGKTPELASPVAVTGGVRSNVDIVVLPDSDIYTGWDDPSFQSDLYDALWTGYYGNAFVLTHQNQLSIWLGHSSADTDGTLATCDTLTPPENWDDYAFADSGWILHSDKTSRLCDAESAHLRRLDRRSDDRGDWPELEGTFDSNWMPITYTLTCTKVGVDRIFPEAIVYGSGAAHVVEAKPANQHWNVWFDVTCV